MKTTLDKNKVVLGLSGGVDSTAAALILKERGLEVIGLYFNVHKTDNLEDEVGVIKARKMANELGIKLIVKDMSNEFEACVIRNFIDEYSNGRTPNPCVMCNPNIKFKTLIDCADNEGAFFIATGHYARTEFSKVQDSYVIKTSKNLQKDQSYMLYRLPSSTIERLIFPLEKVEDKAQTRNFVRKNNLSNADDSDSQEICFVDENYEAFLEEKGVAFKEGNFIDKDGKVLGRHKGIARYTIGQRKGLGIALGKPVFVTKIDYKKNTVTLGDNLDLFKKNVTLENSFFVASNDKFPNKNLLDKKLFAKVRYKAVLSNCELSIKDCKVVLKFIEGQRAPAPGQSAVIYLNDEVVGGGIISSLD